MLRTFGEMTWQTSSRPAKPSCRRHRLDTTGRVTPQSALPAIETPLVARVLQVSRIQIVKGCPCFDGSVAG